MLYELKQFTTLAEAQQYAVHQSGNGWKLVSFTAVPGFFGVTTSYLLAFERPAV